MPLVGPSKLILSSCTDSNLWLVRFINTIRFITAHYNMISKTKQLYEQSPKICGCCNNPIPYKKRVNKYCSHSCAASSTNSNRTVKHNPVWHRKKKPCANCGAMHTNRVYCSRECLNLHTFKRFNAGEVLDRATIYKVLTQLNGEACMMCNLATWLDHKIALEVDHIDGDASNNFPSNVRLICPNCHSTTPSWKGRNKGNGRKSRGLAVY